MALPKVKINYLNGLLGTVAESEDGLLALVTNGTDVSTTFLLGTAYTIYRYSALADLGVTAENNPSLEKIVREFYDEAEDGTKVIILAYADTKTMSDLCDVTTGELKTFLTAQNGAIRGIILGRQPATGYTPVTTDGLDSDVFTALPKAQELADFSKETLNAPVFVALEGRSFISASSLKTLATETKNKVLIFIGDTVSDSDNASIGILAGRIASIPVQRNIGRVKDGSLSPSSMYIGLKLVENAIDDATTINDKGYVTLRSFVGKSGYFFTDDRLPCISTVDYAHLSNRRVIDKGTRLAYATMIEQLLDEIYINEDGTMQSAIIKHWEALVEDDIASNMTANGELSADFTKGEKGCTCFIDTTQNVLSTSKIEMTLKVRPFGYAREIVINLGFQVA